VGRDRRRRRAHLAQLLRVGLDDGSLEHRAQVWAEEEPAVAVRWAMAQPAGLVRDRLLTRVAWVRAQSDPAEAAGLVLNHMLPGDRRDEALLGVIRQWAGRDAITVLAWVDNIPAGPLHTRALAAVETARLPR
jgi:hypothetical protein